MGSLQTETSCHLHRLERRAACSSSQRRACAWTRIATASGSWGRHSTRLGLLNEQDQIDPSEVDAEPSEPVDLLPETLLQGFETQGTLKEDPTDTGNALDLGVSLRGPNSSLVITLVDRILIQALSIGASSIYIEPKRKGPQICFWQGGGCAPAPEESAASENNFSGEVSPQGYGQSGHRRTALASRWSHPEGVQGYAGRLQGQHPAGRFGEKVVMRLLDNSAAQLGLNRLATDQRALALVREMGAKPSAVILVTGSTRSGK